MYFGRNTLIIRKQLVSLRFAKYHNTRVEMPRFAVGRAQAPTLASGRIVSVLRKLLNNHARLNCIGKREGRAETLPDRSDRGDITYIECCRTEKVVP